MTIVLCGAGGYGQTYVSALLADSAEHGVRWVGAVDPYPERSVCKSEIEAAGVPWFGSLEAFYENHTADLCVIASPIAFHAPQSIFAMQRGSHVLCEKPVAALPSEAAAMSAARDKYGKFLGIGYQTSYAAPTRALKRDIADGVYGKLVSARTLGLWPRDRAYYNRGSGWAGRERDAAGRWVLDSVASNATAHYLHNILYLLGGPNRAACPETVSAVLMRANPIEMYDTAFLRMELGAAAVSFVVTHAGEENDGMVSRLTFENGEVAFGRERGERRFVGTLRGGTVIDYGNADAKSRPLWQLIASLRGEHDEGFSCPIEAAVPHCRIMAAALLSAKIGTFPDLRDDGARVYAPGLDELCRACDRDMRLPTKDDAPWARPGESVKLDDPRIDGYGA
jgi:predicted dehydrogenase